MPTERAPVFHLRLPADLKDQLEAAAVENHRSMNAELLLRLQQSFNATATKPGEYRVEDLVNRVSALENIVREAGLGRAATKRRKR